MNNDEFYKERNSKICRRVLTPGTIAEGKSIYTKNEFLREAESLYVTSRVDLY